MSKEESQEHPFVASHTQRSSATDKDARAKDRQKQAKALCLDMAMTFGTPEGKRVLRWIMANCGWGQSVIGGNPALGMDVAQGTLHNGARLGVYLELRKLIPHSILSEVEYENIKEILE